MWVHRQLIVFFFKKGTMGVFNSFYLKKKELIKKKGPPSREDVRTSSFLLIFAPTERLP